ncbi:MAG: TldD/PmbA family protein [Propionibacteriales bacterium]|nr:TldD/PmbA family protein [Propionibacteriales bacterium]
MTSPQELVEHALAAATADHCVVVLRQSSTANLRWANNTLTTNGLMTGSQVTVVSVVDGSAGSAVGVLTRTATSRSQIASVVAAADQAARNAGPADDAAPLVDGGESTGWADPAAQTSLDVLQSFGTSLGEAFDRARSGQRLLYGYVEHDVTTTYLGTSTGVRARHEQPTGHVGITAKPTDLSSSVWVGQAVEQLAEIDVDALDGELVRRLGWAERKVDLPAGRYETLLPPTAVADLAIYAYWVASGRDAHDGQTVYSEPTGGTRVGQQLTRPGVWLRSDPSATGIEATPFALATASSSVASVFDNGLRLSATDWIRDGRLHALMTSRYTGSLTGLATTPGIDNLSLTVDDGAGTVDDLVASSDRALLVTCLWYIREVDPQTLLLTGLTRDGVYLVEGGEVVGAANNFRFNESPIDLLNRFTEAGQTQRSFSREWGDYFPRTQTPTLRIPDFNMSSISQAS